LRVLSEIHLERGVLQREIELDAARVTVDASGAKVPFGMLVYVVQLDERTFAVRPIATDGEPKELIVPAGNGRIAAPPPENPSKDPREWPVRAEIALRPNETKRVTIP
jgi:hypothetical protein